MPLTITSEYTNPHTAIMQKYQNSVRNAEADQKAVVQKANPNLKENISNLRDLSGNDILEYLSVDEKRVLKEVFGDLNVAKNMPNGYYGTKYSDFMKGSQVDIRL